MSIFRLFNTMKIAPETNPASKEAQLFFRNAILNNDTNFIKAVLNNVSNKKPFLDDKYLYLATSMDNFPIAKLLLDHGANPNGMNGGIMVETCRPKNAKMAELFLAKGADPNLNNGILLKNAVQANYVDHVKTLLFYGADPNINKGESLVIAAKKGKFNIVNLLCQYGANPNIDNDKPLLIAEKYNRHRAMLSLLYYGADAACMKKDKNFALARMVVRTKLGAIMDFEPDSILCFPVKSQEQKDYEYLNNLERDYCKPCYADSRLNANDNRVLSPTF